MRVGKRQRRSKEKKGYLQLTIDGAYPFEKEGKR